MNHRFSLEPDEEILDQYVAGIPGKSGKRVNWGGSLHLTDRRLIWEVVRLGRKGTFGFQLEDGLVGVLKDGPVSVAKDYATDAIRDSVGLVIDGTVHAILGDRSGTIIPLTAITGVRPDEGRGSVLFVDTAEGSLRLLTTAGKMGYNKKRDGLVRDAAVDRIRGACGIAHQA